MKKINISVLAILVASAIYTRSDSLAAQGYPMLCRGAGNSALTVTSNRTGTVLTFTFDRSSRVEGSCAWQDRRVSADEPNRLSITYPGVVTSITLLKRTSGEMGFKYELLGGGKTADREHLDRVIKAFRDGNVFGVQAYNDRATGYLIGTASTN